MREGSEREKGVISSYQLFIFVIIITQPGSVWTSHSLLAGPALSCNKTGNFAMNGGELRPDQRISNMRKTSVEPDLSLR